jgi:hypothetical protein
MTERGDMEGLRRLFEGKPVLMGFAAMWGL